MTKELKARVKYYDGRIEKLLRELYDYVRSLKSKHLLEEEADKIQDLNYKIKYYRELNKFIYQFNRLPNKEEKSKIKDNCILFPYCNTL